MMDNDDGIGGEFSLRGRAERVDDAEEVATAYAGSASPAPGRSSCSRSASTGP
jgi:hypothetical protein